MVATPSGNGFTSNPIRVGNVGGTAVIAELGGGLFPDRTVFVTLSTNYTFEFPKGFPLRPPAGASPNFTGSVVPNGTRLQLLKPEADALVAAGYAAYS
jgi:hypothetical protein